MPDKDFLIRQAEKCRRLAAAQTDEKLKAELEKLAFEFEEKVRQAEA